MEAYGWTFDRMQGSHAHFTKPGEDVMTIPLVKGRRVRRIYLTRIVNKLRLND